MAKHAARLIVGISGASGTIYGVRLLEMLRDAEIETHLVMSKSAEMTLAYETDLKPRDVRALASVHYPVSRHRRGDLFRLVSDHGHGDRPVLDPHHERNRLGRHRLAACRAPPTWCSRRDADWCWPCARRRCTSGTCAAC